MIGYAWAGRLDQDAEGLLLITNDGALLNRLSHPRYEVEKSYQVWLDRMPARPVLDEMLRKMQRGIEDDGDRLRIASGRVAGSPPHIDLRLAEGKKREIKRLFAHFQFQVVRLLRTAIGPVELSGLRPGALERMADIDIDRLRDLAQDESDVG
jgi:pseudouridine synthase